MLSQKTWRVSSVVGSILMAFGIVPFVLWVIDYIGWITPDQPPSHWGVIIVAAALFGFGTLLWRGEGDSIADVILNLVRGVKGSNGGN